MTTFSKSNIPAEVTTLEALAVWVGLALYEINPTVTAVEGSGSPVNAAQFGSIYVSSTGKTQVVLRQSLVALQNYASNGKPLWQSVAELSQGAIPSDFLVS